MSAPTDDGALGRVEQAEVISDGAPCPPAYSEEALALQFAESYANELRYVAAWDQWFHWDGMRWKPDKTLLTRDLVRKICRVAANDCKESRFQKALASAKTVMSVIHLAKADQRLAATADQWDRDPWLLNTPSGVIDLRDGSMHKQRPQDHMTKITAVGPGGLGKVWRAFLERVTDGDSELQRFLQRIVGYALTGDTSAHAIFFLFGTGANGKSVFMETISNMLADYKRTAPIETFTATMNDRHPTDLAGLQSARLVTATETEEGRRWAESRIKQLTGGDKISARFMHQDFFEFTPQFKLFVAGNHKPGLRSVDEAMRRRFHLIPFTVTIPDAERDLQLKEKLKRELPGILAWAIEGCLEYQKVGLSPPECVTRATGAYLEAEDVTAAWLEECCTVEPNGWANSTELFASWKNWAEQAGEPVGTQKALTQKLEARGFIPHRKNDGRGFKGIKLKYRADSNNRPNR
ncbi:phage/plasmid primase, P4 family [Janthinobacterium sp.]|uniref:phage/plasmid primase, P4 family n=1 Tax=Janthinobacterium sp. TaxID=1871054 RepID=UPI00293D4723|nr:phage/plasmid primase, P4 family [Janthinobacterium sp.]